jgi:Fe-S cluster assembly protein SufD
VAKLASATTPAAAKRNTYLKHLLTQAVEAADASELSLGLDLKSLRDRAIAQVNAATFPHGRDEEWRFTDLSDLIELPLQRALIDDIQIESLAPALISPLMSESPYHLTTVNGHYALSDPAVSADENAGVIVAPLSELLSPIGAGNSQSAPAQLSQQITAQLAPRLAQVQGNSEVFTALNTAGFTDVMVVWLRADQVLDDTVYIDRRSQGGAIAHLRTLIIAESHSRFTLVEAFSSDDTQARCNNSVTEIWLAEGASVDHIRLQAEGAKTFHIAKTAVSQAANSRYQCTAIDLGAQLSRHHLEIYQSGPQTETQLYGLSVLKDSQLADTHSLISLTHPHGSASQVQKNIVDDRGHSVFNGRVHVSREAQMTDAAQLNRNLLLSNQARVDTKPELDIVADNVKCAHGATVSQLQADELFYLQSRGISAQQAQQLLIYGFAMEIVDTISVAALRKLLSDRITQSNHAFSPTTPVNSPVSS